MLIEGNPALCPLLLLALTGNIASGKSEVARILAELGATVIDADALAREAVRPGTAALQAIAARWGSGVLHPDGSLNRAALRRIVFADQRERDALNAIVHPRVASLRSQLIADARARGDTVVVSDIPLLFEAGLEKDFDRVILVDAPDSVRLERLIRHRHLSAAEARQMMAAQMPSAGKRARADLVIENDSDLAALREAVERAWPQLTRGHVR